MALERDTVAIPFSTGIQPSMRARLLPPYQLITAQNCAFVLDAGPQKRNGHEAHVVRSSASYVGLNGAAAPTPIPPRDTFSTANPGISSSWLYGYGVMTPGLLATTRAPFEASVNPNVGQIVGSTTRDNEIVAWDGHRIFSYAPQQASRFGETQFGTAANLARGPSCMPALRAEPFAKDPRGQLRPDCADNDSLRVAAWVDATGLAVLYSAYDSSNGSCLVSNASITVQSAKSVRVISVGSWFHILISDSTANSLEMRSFHQDSPNTLVARSLGPVDNQFDVKKIDETQFFVVKSKVNTLQAFVLGQGGNTITSFSPALGGTPPAVNGPLACAVDANNEICIVWASNANVVIASYTIGGANVIPPQLASAGAVGTVRRITVAARFLPITANNSIWDIFYDSVLAGISAVQTTCFNATAGAHQAQKFRMCLASHAFTVGNRTFVWCASTLTGTPGLQNTWFLMDMSLLPVGKMDYGLANVDQSATFGVLPSVNFRRLPGHQIKDTIVYHGCLPFKQRVAVENDKATPSGVFAEPSIRFYKLDFLPQLRAGQAGRSTYFAGAQLWAYDGTEVVESGFHMAPEGQTYTPVGSGGSMSAGVVRYRIDLCHKNGLNEEVRSWSIISGPITVVANDSVTCSIPIMPFTRRDDDYFLIFRTKANGTVYYLTSSRDPTSAQFVKNDKGVLVDHVTFVDTLSDAILAAREYHPANAGGNYLDPLPPPACEIVASGRDRLWLAGGELAPGELAPSRLFFSGEAPAFTPALNILIDRNVEPITAIGFMGEIAAIFRRTKVYTVDADGPDNSLNGTWPSPRLAVADTGAVGPESLGLTVNGLWFQSPAGLRLLTHSGTMDPNAGQSVDPITIGVNYAAAVVVPQYTQIRWYSRDPQNPAVVLDYSSGSWSTWTGLTCAGAAFWPVSDLAVLARGDGFIWVEKTGLFSDDGAPYEMITRTSWLRGAQLGDFQRVRRFALFGNATAPVSLRTRLYYDERPFWEEEIVREFPVPDGVFSGVSSTFNDSNWGTSGALGGGENAWGDFSTWGDNENQIMSNGSSLLFRDGVFRFRFRPARQKCSVFSIEFSDLGATSGGFEPVVLALELARKKGLDRIQTN